MNFTFHQINVQTYRDSAITKIHTLTVLMYVISLNTQKFFESDDDWLFLSCSAVKRLDQTRSYQKMSILLCKPQRGIS